MVKCPHCNEFIDDVYHLDADSIALMEMALEWAKPKAHPEYPRPRHPLLDPKRQLPLFTLEEMD